jgi:hypothetical protein
VSTSTALACAALLVTSAHLARAGTNLWTTHGPDGGPVLTLAIDPSSSSTLYAGTLGAGVFKSTDGGSTWSAANSGLPDPQMIGTYCQGSPKLTVSSSAKLTT